MLHSRNSAGIRQVLYQQKLLVESDRDLRDLERKAEAGDISSQNRLPSAYRRAGQHAKAAQASLRDQIDLFQKHQDDAIHHNAEELKASDIVSKNHHANKAQKSGLRMDTVAADLRWQAKEHGVAGYHLLPPKKDEPVGHHIGRLSRLYGEWHFGHKNPERKTFGGGDSTLLRDENDARELAHGIGHHHPHLHVSIGNDHDIHGSSYWYVNYKPKKDQ